MTHHERSPFAAILAELCAATGSLAAALVDHEGETVDYYSERLSQYDVLIAAAEWRLILQRVRRSRVPTWPDTDLTLVRAARSSFAIVTLPEGYALVVQLARRAFEISPRAVGVAVHAVCAEAGLRARHGMYLHERWRRVRVRTRGDLDRGALAPHFGELSAPVRSHSRRGTGRLTAAGQRLALKKPELIWHGGQWRELVLLGRFQVPGARPGLLGFRARLGSGEEFSLVREPLGIWYADGLP